MASTDARPIPKKNTAYRVYLPILDADGDLVTGATGLDSEVSIDGATFADCTNEATEVATSSGIYYLDLTSAEMNGDAICVIVKTSSSGAKTTPIILYPEEAGDIRVDVTMVSGDATAADNAESFFDGTGYAGTNNVIPLVTTTTTATNVTTVNGLASGVITATSIASDAITAAKVAADVTTEIQSGLATAAALATVDTNVDTLVASITTVEAVADAVWDETLSGHLTGGSTGNALNAAGSAGDPWSTALPGAYSSGSAGKIIGDNINATISSRASQTSVDDLPTNAELATSQAAADDATLAAIAALNNLSAAQVNAEVDTAIADAALATAANLATVAGYVDTEITALTTAVDALPTNAELATALGTADDATLTAIAALSIPSATTIADAVLSRGVSNVQDTADTTSLAATVLAMLESSVSGTTWTIRKTTGSTFVVKTVTVDAAADPITGVT